MQINAQVVDGMDGMDGMDGIFAISGKSLYMFFFYRLSGNH
jgi:hypothetical protein